jgi:hypothetical protein
MATTESHLNAGQGARRALVSLSALLLAATAAADAYARTDDLRGRPAPTAAISTRAAVLRSGGYGWPIKPFFRQHPVRGFFGDPRIGEGGHRQFHFGVDVSARNGRAVYATLSGSVSFVRDDAIRVSAGAVAFEYWHILPSVRPGAYVTAYRTVVGHVEKPWAHVHFSETRNGIWVNPLRPGAMAPFADATRPAITQARLLERGDLLADVRDETPLAVRPPWADLPVMPALVQWRLMGRTPGHWTTVADFRWTIPTAGSFDSVYAGATRQNHARLPGVYRLRLGHGVHLAGGVRVQILVADVSGNRSIATFRLGSEGRLVRSAP